jgi:choline dehydrogenase-like flavoprotein
MMSRSENAENPGPVVVVGSGPGGATAALVLAKAGVETVILEAGSEQASLGFTARLRGFTFAKRKPPLQERPDFTATGDSRLRLFEELAPGGLSNHWSCAVPRFSEDDFRDAQRAGEAYEWPVSYSELVPWYERVEPLLGIAGGSHDTPHLPMGRTKHRWQLGREWESVARAAEGLDRSVVVMPYANGASTMATRSGTAFNAYSQLVLPALRAGQLAVRYDAQVQRLEWSPTKKRVVAVRYRDARNGREERVACRAVVVAAGAINSAQILLQSSCSEFPAGLGNEHGVLGRYLHDHPIGKVVVDLPFAVPIYPASYLTRQSLERSAPLYAAACMQWCGAPTLVRSLLQGHPGRARQLGFTIFGTMVPRPEDFVALAPERGGNAARARLSISLQYPREVYETLERVRDELLEILQRAGWKPTLRDWKIEDPGSSVHYGGTCRMHASSSYGVVDSRCRVHGVPNVAVADSSVFTTGPEKNPVLTAMALAARSAALIAQDVRSGLV